MSGSAPSPLDDRGSLQGLRPLGLDAPVSDYTGGLAIGIAGADILAATTQVNEVSVFGQVRRARSVITWRNSGPIPRRRVRTVADFSTLASLALERDLRLERAFLAAEWRWGLTGPRILLDSGERLTPGELVARLPSPDAARDAALARVADVRALYGRMLSDVAYRIENSALFDSAVPLTSRFETALALFSDATDQTTDAELTRRAGLVRVTFDAARANAETLGLGHLPVTARDDARRAAGAARLAASAATEAERAAANAQVVRILGSLALYYLPDVGRGQLER